MQTVFELKKVTKQFGRQVALDDVSLTGKSGSVVALLGENGAGKTTALRILLGLLEPDGGSGRVFGLDSWIHGRQIRRQVGYVPDQPTLYEWMTADEIGWYCGGFYAGAKSQYPVGKVLSRPKHEAMVGQNEMALPYERSYVSHYRRLISEFGLPLKKKISTMSRGMKAKVSLALSIAHEPELLILDEPTAGLDPIVRREFLESMVDVAAADRTVLLSSHQIPEVERVADVVCILKHGNLEVCEPLDELKASLTQLIVTLRHGAPEIPATPGEMVYRVGRDRQWQVLVRDADDGEIEAFRRHENVGGVEVRSPTLEDIYVGFMQGEIDRDSGTAHGKEAIEPTSQRTATGTSS